MLVSLNLSDYAEGSNSAHYQQSGELDPFLDAFDWTDLTGFTFE